MAKPKLPRGIRQLESGRFQARAMVPDNRPGAKPGAKREDSATFDTLTEARAWRETTHTDVRRGIWTDPRGGKVTFDELASRWLAAQTFADTSHAATEQRLRVHILPTFGATYVADIRPSAIAAWLKGRRAVNAASHVLVMYTNLSQVMSAAVDDGLISSNPCSAPSLRSAVRRLREESKHRARVWEPSTVARVVDEIQPVWQGIPLLAFGCGLRQGECFGIRLGDVDWTCRSVRVAQQVKYVDGAMILAPPKGGRRLGRWTSTGWEPGDRERTIPAPDYVLQALAERVRLFRIEDRDALLFTNRNGAPINRSPFNQYQWRPAVQRAGITPERSTGMHILRHSFASHLLSHGESVAAVSRWLGHASVSITLDTYAHCMPDSEERTRKIMEAAFRTEPVSDGVGWRGARA